jgi:hypothetical protein
MWSQCPKVVAVRILAIGAVLILALSACSLGTPSSSSRRSALAPSTSKTPPSAVIATETETPTLATGLGHYSGGELAFDYPASWTPAYYEENSSFSRLIVFLSTERLINPCTTTISSTFTKTDCGSPLGDRRLGADGVLVAWDGRGFPGWSFDPAAGVEETIGGQSATVDDHAAPDYCAATGGEREMIATIPRADAISNWWEMNACYRGPDTSNVRSQLQAMLDSVKWVDAP